MPRYQTYGQYDAKHDEFPESAEKVLRAGEEAAAGDFGEIDGKIGKSNPNGGGGDFGNFSGATDYDFSSTAREANEREGLYREGGAGRSAGLAAALSGARGKSKGGSFLKRRAPLIAIVALIGGMTAVIGFSQVLMPFHVIESLTEMTDGSFTARSARMPKLVKWMFNMDEGNYTENVKSLFGSTTTRFRKSITSNRVRNRLAAEGIEVDTSGKNTILWYQDADGVRVGVTADDYATKYREDPIFRNKMNRGGRSFLGRIAAHIDLTLANFLNSHNLTKNLFKNWINKVYDAEGQTVRLRNVIEARSPTADVRTGAGEYDNPESGRPVDFDADADTDTETLKTNYKDMISNIASITTSAVCGAAAVASAVTAAKVVIAYQNARGAFSGIAESVDKTKAGRGDEAPINASADTMMKKDENGQTMLQSESMKWALSGGTYAPNENAEDVKSSSIDSIFQDSFAHGLTTSTGFIIGCAVARVTTAAVSMVIDIIGNIVTAGAFSVGKLALTSVIGAAVGIVANVAIDSLAEMLVKNATTNFCLDASGPAAGACMYLGAAKYNSENFQAGGGSPATKEKAGEFYDQYRIALEDEAELVRSTKSPFDASSSHTFLGAIMSKIGMVAIEMPSLTSAISMLTNVTTTSLASLTPAASAVDKFSYFANQMRDDCANLQFGDIQALGDLNCEPMFITDQSMNKQVATVADKDGAVTSQDDGDPEYVFLELRKMGSFEEDESGSLVALEDGTLAKPLKKQDKNGNETNSDDGVEIIKEGSLLAKYISYCGYRSSPFGHIDQNILNAESQTTESSTLGAILNAIPIIGDLLDMTEATKQIATIGWSSGANCVAREDSGESMMNVTAIDEDNNKIKNSIKIESWNDFMRYAQAYVADDRFMQTSSEDYISPVQLFVKEQNIVKSDDELSLVEYLAKYSGYTVENMQIALNEIEYWTYIGQYDPEGKGPMKFDAEAETVYDFSEPEVVSPEVLAVLPRRVVYLTREQWTSA